MSLLTLLLVAVAIAAFVGLVYLLRWIVAQRGRSWEFWVCVVAAAIVVVFVARRLGVFALLDSVRI